MPATNGIRNETQHGAAVSQYWKYKFEVVNSHRKWSTVQVCVMKIQTHGAVLP